MYVRILTPHVDRLNYDWGGHDWNLFLYRRPTCMGAALIWIWIGLTGFGRWKTFSDGPTRISPRTCQGELCLGQGGHTTPNTCFWLDRRGPPYQYQMTEYESMWGFCQIKSEKPAHTQWVLLMPAHVMHNMHISVICPHTWPDLTWLNWQIYTKQINLLLQMLGAWKAGAVQCRVCIDTMLASSLITTTLEGGAAIFFDVKRCS